MGIKNTFAAGMEFNIGNLKNALTHEQKRLFTSAWSATSEQETKDEISCEMFGGTYCMWQWQMQFTEGPRSATWNSPLTECTRGTSAPSHAPQNTVKAAPIPELSARSRVSEYFHNSSRFVVLLSLSMVIVLYFAMARRRSGLNPAILQEPLCAAS